jgi:lipopolysaccharide biosynthesis glycosyltransferase
MTKTKLKSSRPAKFRHAIVLCCDENYLPFALFALAQIDALSPDRDFDLVLANSDSLLDLPASLAHLDVRVVHIEVGCMFEGLRLDKGRTADIYLRLALPEAFTADYDRILYMDSDIFVKGGNFSELLRADMGGHAIAAVRDNIQWRTPARRARQFKWLGIPSRPYFNAGVLMMDVPAYIEQRILMRCVELGRANAARMIRHDQNLYNSVLQGDWAELSPVWNWQYTWSSRLIEPMADANILHFIGSKKPWNYQGGEFPPRFRKEYARFIAQHFPQHKPLPEEGVRAATNGGFHRKMLIKHWMSNRAMMRYLSRFPDEMSIYK